MAAVTALIYLTSNITNKVSYLMFCVVAQSVGVKPQRHKTKSHQTLDNVGIVGILQTPCCPAPSPKRLGDTISNRTYCTPPAHVTTKRPDELELITV